MKLVDDTELEAAVFFDAMVQEFPGVVDFDWDMAWAAASEPIEPWQWEWRTPLRGMLQQLVGRPDVTAWTMEAGRELAARLSMEETELLPTVSATDDSDATEDSVTVCAEGDEGPSTL